jgi:hypothetical protein
LIRAGLGISWANLGFRLKVRHRKLAILVATRRFVFDLDRTLTGFVLGKYVDPFGFRRLDTLIRAGLGFHGREFRV